MSEDADVQFEHPDTCLLCLVNPNSTCKHCHKGICYDKVLSLRLAQHPDKRTENLPCPTCGVSTGWHAVRHVPYEHLMIFTHERDLSWEGMWIQNAGSQTSQKD